MFSFSFLLKFFISSIFITIYLKFLYLCLIENKHSNSNISKCTCHYIFFLLIPFLLPIVVSKEWKENLSETIKNKKSEYKPGKYRQMMKKVKKSKPPYLGLFYSFAIFYILNFENLLISLSKFETKDKNINEDVVINKKCNEKIKKEYEDSKYYDGLINKVFNYC